MFFIESMGRQPVKGEDIVAMPPYVVGEKLICEFCYGDGKLCHHCDYTGIAGYVGAIYPWFHNDKWVWRIDPKGEGHERDC